MIVGQGPITLAVGAGGGYLDIFSLVYHFCFLSPSLWETAQYRLKYCLKGPLSANQPTKLEPAHVERVTKKKAKDPKRVAAGRAGAAARQKRLLEQVQAAKESLRPPVSVADNDGVSASPKEAYQNLTESHGS